MEPSAERHDSTARIYPPLTRLAPQSGGRYVFYTHWWHLSVFFYFFYWNCEISPCCFTPSFIVGYLWSSAQGVATSCSLCAFQSVVWWQTTSLLGSDGKFTCHFMSLISSLCNTFLWSHITCIFSFDFLGQFSLEIQAETFYPIGREKWKLRTAYTGCKIVNYKHSLTSEWAIWLAAVRDIQEQTESGRINYATLCVKLKQSESPATQEEDLLGVFATAASAQNGKCGILMHSWCWRIWGNANLWRDKMNRVIPLAPFDSVEEINH